jgi:hypothetical protein
VKTLLIILVINILLPVRGNAEIKIFNPFQNQKIRDLVFDVTSPNIDKLLHTKLMLPKKEEFRIRIYWHKGQKTECEIISKATEVDQKLIGKVKDSLFDQVQQLMLSNLYSNLSDYKKVKHNNKRYEYFDETGLNEMEEATIQELSNMIKISIKRPGSKENTKYHMKQFPWSNKQPVIYKVQKVNINKLQKTEIDTSISYKRFGQYWMPHQINSKVEQNLRVSPVDKYKSERSLSEQLRFENYQINKNMALKWFAKQK